MDLSIKLDGNINSAIGATGKTIPTGVCLAFVSQVRQKLVAKISKSSMKTRSRFSDLSDWAHPKGSINHTCTS